MPLYFKCLTGNFKARKLIRPMGCNHRDLGTGIQRSISMHTTVRRRCEWVKRERESVFNNCYFVPEKEKWIGDRERGLTLKVKTEERERERKRERDSLLKMIQRTRKRERDMVGRCLVHIWSCSANVDDFMVWWWGCLELLNSRGSYRRRLPSIL